MKFEKLSVTLPADLAEMVRGEVEKGRYVTESEVVRDALDLWDEHRRARERRLVRIRQSINEAAEDPREITDEEVERHFERRFAEAEKKQAS